MPPSNSSYFPKAPYSNIITRSRWVGFQHTNLGRHRHSHQTVITERWETTELKLTNASDYCFEGFYTTSQGGESEEDISDQLSCEDGADGLGYKAARVDKVKNPSAIQEIPVRFLGQEVPLEKGQFTHSDIIGLPWWLSW